MTATQSAKPAFIIDKPELAAIFGLITSALFGALPAATGASQATTQVGIGSGALTAVVTVAVYVLQHFGIKKATIQAYEAKAEREWPQVKAVGETVLTEFPDLKTRVGELETKAGADKEEILAEAKSIVNAAIGSLPPAGQVDVQALEQDLFEAVWARFRSQLTSSASTTPTPAAPVDPNAQVAPSA